MPNPIANRKALQIPHITRELKMSDYAPDMEGSLHVWVNLSQKTHVEFNVLQAEIQATVANIESITTAHRKKMAAEGKPLDTPIEGEDKERLEALRKLMSENGDRMYALLSVIWSQHKDKKTHVTPEQVSKFAAEVVAEDEALWYWIVKSTYALIIAHRNDLRKN